MQTKSNDVWTVSDELTSNSVTLADSTGSIAVLDEAALEDISGGGWKDWVKPLKKVVNGIGSLFSGGDNNTRVEVNCGP